MLTLPRAPMATSVAAYLKTDPHMAPGANRYKKREQELKKYDAEVAYQTRSHQIYRMPLRPTIETWPKVRAAIRKTDPTLAGVPEVNMLAPAQVHSTPLTTVQTIDLHLPALPADVQIVMIATLDGATQLNVQALAGTSLEKTHRPMSHITRVGIVPAATKASENPDGRAP